LVAVPGSFEPKHEHKEAAAGWLMSMWCETPKFENIFSQESFEPAFVS
jgi:hypothetical protein